MDNLAHLPSHHRDYLSCLTTNIHEVLQDSLIGIYLFGSGPCSYYQPGKSDFDVTAVITSSLPQGSYEFLISRISHASLPCPARKLEFVLYTKGAINAATQFPKFELNFNTGSRMTDYVSFKRVDEAGHWFLLDIDMGRDLGIQIWGPQNVQMEEIFARPPRPYVVDAILESIGWYIRRVSSNRNTSRSLERRNQSECEESLRESVDAVLNACRGWRWVVAGRWGSKVEGGEWVLEVAPSHDVSAVTTALALRCQGNGTLEEQDAIGFLEYVEGVIQHSRETVDEERAAKKAPPSPGNTE